MILFAVFIAEAYSLYKCDTQKPFVLLYDFELDTICNSEYKVDKNLLLLTFVTIKSHINNQTKICYPTIDTIQRECNIKSNNTVLYYIDILKELGLILFENVGTRVFKDGTIKQAGNIYTMNYEGHDKYLQTALDRYKVELEADGIKITKAKDANRKRSEAMTAIWAERKRNQFFIK